MDILEQYNKEYSEISQQGRNEYNDISENSEISQWLIRHSGGYITNKKQANYAMTGCALLMILVSLFLLLNRNKFPLTPEEEKLFMGKTATEKLLIPQQRDQFLFNK